MTFPNDDTGNVLAEMQQAGIELTSNHDVVFFQLFETKEQAEKMVEYIKENHSNIGVVMHPDESPNVWDVDCTINMQPSYQGIIDQELVFEKIAAQFDGYNDGWGIEA